MSERNAEFPDYKAVLSIGDGEYRFHIRELGIIATGASIETAFNELEEKKRKVLEEFADAGLVDELPPSSSTEADADKTGHRNFAIRTLIVAVAVLGIVVAATIGARSVITAGVDAVKIKPGGVHLKLLEDKLIATLHAAADPRNDYSAEKRAQVIEDLRTIVERYKPFADEIRPLISGDDSATPPQSTTDN